MAGSPVNENPDGILGNLPRSRPGVRSDKRAGGATPPKRTPAKPKAGAEPRAVKAAAEPKAPQPPPRQAPPQKQPDTMERAVQLAGDVAETGIKVAAKVAVGVLRRLPRP
jgi:hypothetical protein